jgi:hypothetical protein
MGNSCSIWDRGFKVKCVCDIENPGDVAYWFLLWDTVCLKVFIAFESVLIKLEPPISQDLKLKWERSGRHAGTRRLAVLQQTGGRSGPRWQFTPAADGALPRNWILRFMITRTSTQVIPRRAMN